MKRLRPLRWLVWLGLPLVLLWLLRSSPLGEIRAILSSINPGRWLDLIAFNGLVMVCCSAAAGGWRCAARATTCLTWRSSATAWPAFAISYFTPGTQFGGEPLQVYTAQQPPRRTRSQPRWPR